RRTRGSRLPRRRWKPPSDRGPGRRRAWRPSGPVSEPPSWTAGSSLASQELLAKRHHRQRRARRAAALVALAGPRPGPGLRLVLDGQDAVADAEALAGGQFHESARGLIR